MTDTQRLDWLLTYVEIGDVGDADFVPGVIVRYEDLETVLTEETTTAGGIGCDMRRLIDLAADRRS